MPGGMVVCFPRVKMRFRTFWVENVENRGISLHFRRCGHEPGADLGGRKNQKLQLFQKLIKLHEMTGNDQTNVWECHLGAETIHFGDLGGPGRYSSVLESEFHVDSQNPKVGYGG